MPICAIHNNEIEWSCHTCDRKMCPSCQPIAWQGKIYCSTCVSKKERFVASNRLQKERANNGLKILKIVIPLICIILLASTAKQGCSAASKQYLTMRYEKTRPQAPEFQANDLDGRNWSLEKMRGKVVILNFWASWCPVCMSSMPALKKLNDKQNKDSFVMLGINLDKNTANLEKTLKSYSIDWPQIPDPSQQIADLYKVRGIPHFALIDKNGKIFLSGHISINALRNYVSFLIEQSK
jgi:thiol-disulfide isomerase/thioredoxin